MARVETVLTVFVACPGDVKDARKRLDKVVAELNRTWSREYGRRLDLVKWETHAYSDVGTDGQDVINRQLSQFDIFLGIMWKRFGQPTPRAESGTQEEFRRARQRQEKEGDRVRIMFYFKDAPPGRLSDVDARQIEAVRKFQQEVGQSGVLWFEYRTINQFESLVRQHLSRQVQTWGKEWGNLAGLSAVSGATDDDRTPDDTSPDASRARSITGIVFEEMAGVEPLRQRPTHDPDVVHWSFLEAQSILDSSSENDDWGRLAAQQAAALVGVALGGRFVEGTPAQVYLARVSDRIIGLRGGRIDWGEDGETVFYRLLIGARERHDDDVLLWIKEHTAD
jgi:hypothetical protein